MSTKSLTAELTLLLYVRDSGGLIAGDLIKALTFNEINGSKPLILVGDYMEYSLQTEMISIVRTLFNLLSGHKN